MYSIACTVRYLLANMHLRGFVVLVRTAKFVLLPLVFFRYFIIDSGSRDGNAVFSKMCSNEVFSAADSISAMR